MLNKEQATTRAQYLVDRYPQARTVQQVIDCAITEDYFQSNDEMMAIWGRVCRLLPQDNLSDKLA